MRCWAPYWLVEVAGAGDVAGEDSSGGTGARIEADEGGAQRSSPGHVLFIIGNSPALEALIEYRFGFGSVDLVSSSAEELGCIWGSSAVAE
ncbi:hypothetical protein Droror1_Dr00020205, partial [Drosera rotundifolia]